MSIHTSARLIALMKSFRKSLKLPALVLLFFQLNLPVGAVAPHPKVIERLRADGRLEAFYQREAAARRAGVNAPSADPIRTPGMLLKSDPEKYRAIFGGGLKRSAGSAAGEIDTIKVLVILVEFTDNPHDAATVNYVNWVSATPAMFDSVLFSTAPNANHNVTGSMTDYYMEMSYGTFLIQGVISGWHMMPETYDYYLGVSRDGLTKTGPNAQDLARDAINKAFISGVDFSQFDSFGPAGVPDGIVDGVFIVHAGTGFEESWRDGLEDIRSHKWQLKTPPLSLSGVTVSSYTMEPEETYIGKAISPIGVFCHEYGHILGLPDLYDTDDTTGTSEGLGKWSVMASGNYLGGSRTPAGFDCWSKAHVGFLQPIDVPSNLRDVTLQQVYDNQVCYKLRNNKLPAGEYFLVENRQRVGFDSFLPGAGLLIYHVDQAFNSLFDNNDNENRYLVALEQADGFNQLAFGENNGGDASDPFSLTNGFPEFHALTTPSSRSNDGATTQIAVWDISASGPSMTANLDISYSRPFLTEFQPIFFDRNNGNGTIEGGENFEIIFTVTNLWAPGVGMIVTASSPNPDITFTDNSINLGTLSGFGAKTISPVPFKFTVASAITPRIDSIYFNFVSEGGLNNIQLGVQIEVGKPQALIVNADKDGQYTDIYAGDMFDARLPYRTHITRNSGLPTSARLSDFPMVIWYFGNHSTTPPSAAEIQRIKTYIDGGGNLMISGMNLAEQLHNVDSTFMHNYLHAVADTVSYEARQVGVSGSRLGDGISRFHVFGNGGASNWTPTTSAYAITPVNGGQPEFKGFGTIDSNSFHVISYSGASKLVFFSFPFEAIEQNESARQFRTQRDEVLTRVLQFFYDIPTDAGPDDNIPLVPRAFALAQNYPNPFNPTTTIKYTINHNGGQRTPITELVIFNVLGQQVRQLVARVEGPGAYQIEWNGADDDGHSVSSGIYFYRLKRGNLSESRKMVLLK